MRPLHHHIVEADIESLRPTQVTIGFAEVRAKRAEWQALSKRERKALLARHWFPAVIGPQGSFYIVDHHHLGMALHEVGQPVVQLTVLKDLSWLDRPRFWRFMEFHQWVHPYDEHGQRVSFAELPKRVRDLRDDPYRSLAGLAREAGAFAKDVTPFSEFLWADYFRGLVSRKALQSSTKAALARAIKLARQQEASYLPGWAGKSV